jgi:pyruvyl transferase EpsI
VKSLASAARRALKAAWASTIAQSRFARSHRDVQGRRKIIYALTPPPYLQNVGDHAQAVAIHAWFAKHFPELPVVEVDKDQCKHFLSSMRRLIGPDDLIFLHSGGNLGDRARWSEGRRRLIIRSFPGNRIISLPQTIFFSDTPTGRQERERTRSIYAAHRNLTVMGRDRESGRLAEELFLNAQTLCVPDFVLSMPPRQPKQKGTSGRALACVRDDPESALSGEQRERIAASLPFEWTYFDTTIKQRIPIGQREAVLERTLDLFNTCDLVVSDRYHGVIFSVLCRTPCVALPTVDHKLVSAMEWFKDVPFVELARSVDEIASVAQSCIAARECPLPDWNALYFDKLPEQIGLGSRQERVAA